MSRWKRTSQTAMLLASIAVSISLLPSLGGCVAEDSALGRLVEALVGGSSLPADARHHVARFRVVHDEFASTADDTQIKHFSDAFGRVRADYVREVADAALIDAAIAGVRGLDAEPGTLPPGEVIEAGLDGLMGALDPHSSYLNPDDLRETRISISGEFGGLGIEVTMEDELVKIIAPIEDTPAYRAGLKSGDLITHLNGDSVRGMTLMQAVKRMRGRSGTDIRLSINRIGFDSFDVTITRAVIMTRPVRWSVEGTVGYIRVAHFTERMEDGLDDAVEGIRERLGDRLSGVVLDLRNNPGGPLDQSLILADAFLENGRIVSMRGRDRGDEQVVWAQSGDVAEGLPVVVLINGGSASASEIVAGALQDHGRATIMGMRSFGKGSVQTILPLPVEGALRLTTSLYYAPSGRTIQAAGVTPDIVVTAENAPRFSREADNPRALHGDAATLSAATRANLDESDCPPAGEKNDRLLGCAITFLRAGSTEDFLAALGHSQTM